MFSKGLLQRTSTEVNVNIRSHQMCSFACTTVHGNVIYHKFSHGDVSKRFNAKNVFVRIIHFIALTSLYLCNQNTLIMKWQPAYDICKLFDKALGTTYAEPKWKATRAGTGRDFVPESLLPAGTRYHSILNENNVVSVCPLHTCARKGYETVEIFVLIVYKSGLARCSGHLYKPVTMILLYLLGILF